jgi:polysaccharide biosynthesis transport protein
MMNGSMNGGEGDAPRFGLTPLARPAVGMASVQAPAAVPRTQSAEGVPFGSWLRVLREHWLLIAASCVIVTAGVAAGVLLTEPAYRATGTIEIRKQSAEVVPVDALFQFERISEQYLQTEYGTLRSRTLLQRTVARPELAARMAHQLGVTEAGRDAGPAVAPDLARIAARAHRHLLVDPVAGSRIVKVSFESTDAQLAADVVNTLIAEYVALRQEAGAAALVRLDEQADSVRGHLLQSERELQRFVAEAGLSAIVIGGTDGVTVPQERLRRLQDELTSAETDGYRTAAASLSSGLDQAVALESDLLRNLRVRIAELEGEYARLRPTFTDTFPKMMQLRSELSQLDALVAAEQRRVGAAMATQHESTRRRRELLQDAVAEQQRLIAGVAVNLAEYERRQRELESRQQLYAVLQQKRKEAALSAALSTMDVAVLDPALPSRSPVRPRPRRDIPLAVLAGLVLGVGFAFLREYADQSVKTPEEAVGFGTAPLLAVIPSVPLRTSRLHARTQHTMARGSWHRIDERTPHDPQLADAFHGLRTSVLFDAGGALPRTLLVTSSAPGEGKTTVSVNLAISMANLGRRVLIVDADLRRPSLHQVFGVPQRYGLAEQLAGTVPWQQSLRRDVSPGLDLLTAGAKTSSPPDLFASGRIDAWLADVATAYDFIVLDAPALFINMPDARLLAHATDGVLLVVRSGSTPRDVVSRLIAQTPNLVGLVLNQFDRKRLPAYYSDYGEPGPASAEHQRSAHSGHTGSNESNGFNGRNGRNGRNAVPAPTAVATDRVVAGPVRVNSGGDA